MCHCLILKSSSSQYAAYFARRILHLFHLQRIQLLLSDDHPKGMCFTYVILQQSVQDVNISIYVLFIDRFTRGGVCNQQNAHLWAQSFPRGVRQHLVQHRSALNVQANLVVD